MTNTSKQAGLPLEQQDIHAKCFHPSGSFVEFKKEEVEQSIPDRFEKLAVKYPDRLAVNSGDSGLTYGELNRSANRLARTLTAASARQGERIAVLLGHDASLITAILGILKAGKIFVPLDPFFPPVRNSYILDDSEAAFVLTNNKYARLADSLSGNPYRVINTEEVDSKLSDENLTLPIGTDAIAHILYTSGSTGKPKGVFHNHRNVLHDTMQFTNTLHIGPADRINLFYSCSARSLRGIWGALLNGAALFFFNVKKEGVTGLAAWLIRQQITIYHSVPSVFRQVVATLTGKEELPHLRLIRLGGEQVLARDIVLYKTHFSPDCILSIGTGTTETGTFRHLFVDQNAEIGDGRAPAGYPIEDRGVSIINDAGEDIGCTGAGEIAVKSRYLALGYWRRPDLTQNVFHPDPGGGDERVYLTGDLGRMSPEGCLIHLGRKDFQVKIRGNRVELSEIELALLGHEAIQQAAVLAREDHVGDHRLVAYVVPDHSNVPTVSGLRRFLQGKLPDYMLPSSFVFLKELPFTPNGKVDRLALPLPEENRPLLDNVFQEPQTLVEKALAEIWRNILRLDRVGVHDNFLDLGGHSLMATQVISRIIDKFQVELPMKALLEAPTIADMSEIIMQHQAQSTGGEAFARMLTEIETLSDEKAKQLVADSDRPRRSRNE